MDFRLNSNAVAHTIARQVHDSISRSPFVSQFARGNTTQPPHKAALFCTWQSQPREFARVCLPHQLSWERGSGIAAPPPSAAMNHWPSLPSASDLSCPLALHSGGELHRFVCPRSTTHRSIIHRVAHNLACHSVDNRYAARTVVSMCPSPLRLNTRVANAVGSVCLIQSILPRLPTAVASEVA
jgi:hypothetical protein